MKFINWSLKITANSAVQKNEFSQMTAGEKENRLSGLSNTQENLEFYTHGGKIYYIHLKIMVKIAKHMQGKTFY